MSWKNWKNRRASSEKKLTAESTVETTAKFSEESQTKTLIVSRAILMRTYQYFLPYSKARVETACFWFGVDAGHLQIVTTVAVPKLFQTRGNYQVEKTSMRRLAAAMREKRLTNLAQIHTHPPGCDVKHSLYDDEHAYSTKDGALSLVWGDYGSHLRSDLHGIGIHERRDGEWILLSEKKASQRILLADDFADFRWEIEEGSIRYEE